MLLPRFIFQIQLWDVSGEKELGGGVSSYASFLYRNFFRLMRWSDGMRCCRSDWPGLCLICCHQPSRVVSQQSWFGLFISEMFQFYSPNPGMLLLFFCLEFQIILLVRSTFTPIFFIEISFVNLFHTFPILLPPPPRYADCWPAIQQDVDGVIMVFNPEARQEQEVEQWWGTLYHTLYRYYMIDN